MVQSLATEWGLFRHYWVIAKFALTTFGAIARYAITAPSQPTENVTCDVKTSFRIAGVTGADVD
jgi:hypothetical protein